MVKPVAAGSSYGVTRVDHEADLDAALAAALALDDRVLVEEVVHGREIDIAVLGRPDGSHLIGPPLEIVVPDGGIFDTDRKYGGTAQFRLPAVLDADELTRLETAALTMFEALGCAGVARLDFFLTHTGLVLNEVNTTPGMTEQSQVPKMFAAVGISYTALLTELVQAALAR
ncbi:D-alanine--D-alanine ligase family protein [Dactylosporangium darangshiense]|uniref:D-alanine--D-alanine ligase family protein n=1 Tax=Dactylosporangium darangshiense TaxID=579108 RepID=UPI003633F584